MVDGVVLYDGINRYGLHQVHVMRGGRPVDLDAWLKHLGVGQDRLRLHNEYIEDETQMWHLHLAWMEPDFNGAQWEKIATREIVGAGLFL